jgi:aryl-alcohol dehydrogenase-like predicted oxidoreductase
MTTGIIALGDLRVRRLGFGAMRISAARNAAGVRDPEAGRALMRRAVERGVTFFDTANMYGLGRSEELIAEPLHPYPAGVVIGTKSGYQTRRLPPGGCPRTGVLTTCWASVRRACDVSGSTGSISTSCTRRIRPCPMPRAWVRGSSCGGRARSGTSGSPT